MFRKTLRGMSKEKMKGFENDLLPSFVCAVHASADASPAAARELKHQKCSLFFYVL